MTSPLPLRPVIIIDDEPDDLFLLRRLLEKGGVQNPVITFLDSEDVRTFFAATAIIQKKLPEFAPCALFTDLKMPKTDGFELLSWLRKQRDFDALTIVVMSSSDHPEGCRAGRKTRSGSLPTEVSGAGSHCGSHRGGSRRPATRFHDVSTFVIQPERQE